MFIIIAHRWPLKLDENKVAIMCMSQVGFPLWEAIDWFQVTSQVSCTAQVPVNSIGEPSEGGGLGQHTPASLLGDSLMW